MKRPASLQSLDGPGETARFVVTSSVSAVRDQITAIGWILDMQEVFVLLVGGRARGKGKERKERKKKYMPEYIQMINERWSQYGGGCGCSGYERTYIKNVL